MSLLSTLPPLQIIGIGLNASRWPSTRAYLQALYFASQTSAPFSSSLSPQERLAQAIQEALSQSGSPADIPILVASSENGAAQLAASWLSRRSSLSGPVKALSGDQAWLPNALQSAADSLSTNSAILLASLEHLSNGSNTPSSEWQATAFVICHPVQNAKQASWNLEACSGSDDQPSTQVAFQSCLQAAIHPDSSPTLTQVELLCLDAATSDPRDPDILRSLNAALHGLPPASCALTASQSGGMLPLITALLSLQHRFFPSSPGWEMPRQVEYPEASPFFIPEHPHPWFSVAGSAARHAAVLLKSNTETWASLVVSSPEDFAARDNSLLESATPHLFPLAATTLPNLLAVIESLRHGLSNQVSTAALSRELLFRYGTSADYPLSACLLASTPEDLEHEIEFALKGIPRAFESGGEWQTPAGSYFTAQPLGKSGTVAFVYPGAFNTFLTLGCDLFQLFPQLYPQMSTISTNFAQVFQEQLLYPRSLMPFDSAQLESMEAQLNADPVAMLTSGVSLSALYTLLMRGVFGLHPGQAFGYSLGECSMLFALQAWSEGDSGSQKLAQSPLFQTRLSGPKMTLREQWGLPDPSADPQHGIWSNLLLMATPQAVRDVLQDEPHVFLTHINTPRQVVIGGDPLACRRVAERLKCPTLQAPFEQVLHCDPVRKEYAELVLVNTYPTQSVNGTRLFSAAHYAPVQFDSQAIAGDIAEALCSCLDFPRLVDQVYADGARIFIELGAGSNCSRWIDESLKGQPHTTAGISRKGASDLEGILRLLARLISHRVPLQLDCLISGD